MTLQDVIKIVDELSADERFELRAYLDQQDEFMRPSHTLSPQERISRLDEVAKTIRAGFTDDQWAEVEQEMKE